MNLVTAYLGQRLGGTLGIDEADEAQPHASSFLDHRRHLAGSRAATHDEQVVVAPEAVAHDGDTPVGGGTADQQKHEIHGTNQQDIATADVGLAQQVQAGVHHDQDNRQLTDDFQDKLDWIREFQVTVEAGEVSDDGPYREERHHQWQIMTEGIDLWKALAEKMVLDQKATQQVGTHEGDTRHPKVVE